MPILRKILVFAFFAILGLGAWWFLDSFQEFQIRGVEPVTGIGGGDCPLFAYDDQGRRVEFFYGALDSPTPGLQLYLISPENLVKAGYEGGLNSAACFNYPENVRALDTSAYGIPLVPVGFSAGFPSENIQKGSSVVLKAQLSVVDESQAERWIAIEPGGSTPIVFRIEQANFIFSPTNEEFVPVPLSREQPAAAEWVVAPRLEAAGLQTIRILVLGDLFEGAYTLEVDVVPAYGDLPVYVGVITGLVGFLASTLDIAERVRKLFRREPGPDKEAPAGDEPSG